MPLSFQDAHWELVKRASSELFLRAVTSFPIPPEVMCLSFAANGILPFAAQGREDDLPYVNNCARAGVKPYSSETFAYNPGTGLMLVSPSSGRQHHASTHSPHRTAVALAAIHGGKTHVVELEAQVMTEPETYEAVTENCINPFVKEGYQLVSGTVLFHRSACRGNQPSLKFAQSEHMPPVFELIVSEVEAYTKLQLENWYCKLAETKK